MRLWKPATLGFPARVSPISPWNQARPTDIGEKSPRPAVPRGLVSRSTPRGAEAEVAPAPALDLLLQPCDDSFSSAGVPAVSSFASGDSPLPVPSHLLAPKLGFLLSSHLFLYILLKKIRGQEQEEILAWVQRSRLSDTHASLHSP